MVDHRLRVTFERLPAGIRQRATTSHASHRNFSKLVVEHVSLPARSAVKVLHRAAELVMLAQLAR
jgi:pyridoxal biosynthesis lyase PdxS